MIDSPAALAWVANYGAVELHPVDVDDPRHEATDVGADRHRSRDRHDLRGRPGAGPSAPHRPRTPRRAGRAQGDRQARHPDLGPRRRPLHVRPDPRSGSSSSRERSAPRCPSWSAGSGRCKRRAGLARLDYTQNAINKTLVAPFSVRAAPGAPVSVPIAGTSSTIPSSAPTAGRSRRSANGSTTPGTRWLR